ncbi:PAS domain S-box protein [Nisaea acidiphila]|uniref:histidine kinase n=1 Tax=Nisaea acidiphila TaxID=1862145 RepID=A0A9J7AR27_9PROT|nr:PAS domain-containing protein [Nisaea acidiphila]UUX49832.1 PAS domain S-box protein [Nisaea acidiphila]
MFCPPGSPSADALFSAIESAPDWQEPASVELELVSASPTPRFFTFTVGKFDEASSLVLIFDMTAHMTNAHELEDRRLELEAIFDYAPVMIGLKSVDGRWRKINRFFADVLETSPDELIGKRSEEIWPPEMYERVQKHDQRILSSGRTATQVLTSTSNPGERSIYGTKFAVRDNAGSLAQIGFVGVDISDLVEAKKEADLMALRLREAQRIGNVAYWTWDPVSDVLFWSDELFTLLGWDPANPPQNASDYFECIHPDDRAAFLDRTRRVDQGARVTIEYRFTAPDGRTIWLHDEALPRLTPDGQKFGFIHDITERKESEIRLRESEMRLSLAKRIAGIGTWEVDQKTRALVWSDEVYAIFGQNKSEQPISISKWMKLLHPGDHESYLRLRGLSIANRRTYQVEYRVLHPDGTHRIVLEHGEHEFDPDGTLSYTRGTVQDITELKNLRNRAIEAEKLEATAALAGGLTHDFNNILGAIAGNLDIMEIRGAARLGFEPPLDRIRQAVHSGQSLTQRLLNFSQNSPPAPKPVSMNRAIEGFAALARSGLRDGYTLTLDVSSAPLVCEIDKNGLETALLNQIINAKQAMPDGGPITISLSRAGTGEPPDTLPPARYVKISVADAGPGMAPDVANHAFNAFFTTKRECGGTGLGLYMVRNFALQHGGDAVLHTAPGRGTRLTLYLPESTARQAEVSDPASEERASDRQTRILIVEDQPGIRAFIEDCLVDDGYEVSAVATTRDALERLENDGSSFDAMICDINLGSAVDGFDVAKRCRDLQLDYPIVFVSGFADGARALSAVADFNADLIKKPFGVADLRSTLKKALARSRRPTP